MHLLLSIALFATGTLNVYSAISTDSKFIAIANSFSAALMFVMGFLHFVTFFDE